jgi:photosystem II stability/assembly factor-like uncharacterized protein
LGPLLLAAGLRAAATPAPPPQEQPAGAATEPAAVTGSEPEWAVMARLAPRALVLDAARHGDLVLAVGERGHVLLSRDGGVSFAQAKVPTRALLTGVFVHDERLAWAVGHDAVVVRTRDGGLSWERVHDAPEAERPLLDVWFENAERGLAASAYGELLVTRDGGSSWERRAIRDGDDFHLNQLAAATDGALYAAAEAGHLYRSDDGGESWVPLTSPYEGSFFGVLPLAGGRVLAFGLRGRLFSSADRGKTWARIETATEATLLCGLETGPSRFVIAGMEGTLVYGDAAAGTARSEGRPDRRAILAIEPGPGGSLLLFGEGGVRRIEGPR